MKQKLTVKQIAKIAVPILKRNDIKKAALFGSHAKGTATTKSDVDILVRIPKKKSLYDVVGIKLDLEDALGKKVDLVDYKLIRPELKDSILQGKVEML
jgi:uncharacterized protein